MPTPRTSSPSIPARPLTEKWTHEEKEYFSPLFNTQVVTNVVKPTLTKFAPTAESSNGTAVVICPGGGFHALSINSEGVDVAKWLNEKGVTGFVLKYRLVPTGKDGVVEMLGKGREKVEEDMRSVFELAAANGAAAREIRSRSCRRVGGEPQTYQPDGLFGRRIGGDGRGSALLAQRAPDFVAPIYAYLGVIGKAPVPADAPAALCTGRVERSARAGRRQRGFVQQVAGREKVGRAAHVRQRRAWLRHEDKKLPSDHWIELFGTWLTVRDF